MPADQVETIGGYAARRGDCQTNALRAMSIEEIVSEMFTYHPPEPDQIPRYAAVRDAAKYFAGVIVSNVPHGADRTAAIRKLRECVMTANAAIALNGLGL